MQIFSPIFVFENKLLKYNETMHNKSLFFVLKSVLLVLTKYSLQTGYEKDV